MASAGAEEREKTQGATNTSVDDTLFAFFLVIPFLGGILYFIEFLSTLPDDCSAARQKWRSSKQIRNCFFLSVLSLVVTVVTAILLCR